MKRLLILLSLLFCDTVCADTINLHWLNEDGTTYQDSTCVIDSDLILPSTPPTKYGYTFTGWKFASYIPIEYLNTNAGAMINTEIIPTSTQGLYIHMKFRFNSFLSNSINGIFGYMNQNNGNIPRFSFFYNAGYQQFGFGVNNTDYFDINNIGTTKIYDVFFENGAIKIGIETHTVGSINTNNFLQMPIYFGARGDENGRATWPSNIDIYEFEIIYNGTHKYFIPVRDTNGTPCMYDKVEKKFYYNAGTGQFIAGPVITE